MHENDFAAPLLHSSTVRVVSATPPGRCSRSGSVVDGGQASGQRPQWHLSVNTTLICFTASSHYSIPPSLYSLKQERPDIALQIVPLNPFVIPRHWLLSLWPQVQRQKIATSMDLLWMMLMPFPLVNKHFLSRPSLFPLKVRPGLVIIDCTLVFIERA